MAAPATPRQQVTIAKSTNTGRSAGVLPVQAISQKPKPANLSNSGARVAAPRLKVIIRRLPPGLTEAEFRTMMGIDWELGEKVDWVSFIPGKISKDSAKPSRPSRGYYHLTKQEYLAPFSEKVRQTSFTDAKASLNDAALLGPPSVEFAPYGRVPTNKPRKDGRQGTIDQDQEFIDFLQELTNPISKPVPVDASEKAGKGEKVVTPLIQFLRDKKANKGKETAAAKVAKQGRPDAKDPKTVSAADKKAPVKGRDMTSDRKGASVKVEKQVEKAAREAVKVLNKQPVSKAHASPASTTQAANAAPNQKDVVQPAKPERRRERGSAAAAAKILQRDLGIGGASTGRRRRDNSSAAASNTTTSAPAASGKSVAPNGALATTQPPQTTPKSVQPPTGPAATRNQQRQTPTVSTLTSQQIRPAPVSNVSPTATQAFLKHANPSQGITEPLLFEAFASFGNVAKVEIDKKKGFAYIDFAEPASLQKALFASPIKVAQGQVVVLERKTGVVLQNRNTKVAGNVSGVRGGAGNTANQRGAPTVGGPRGGRVRGRGGHISGATHVAKGSQASATSNGSSRVLTPTSAKTSSTTPTQPAATP